MAHTNGTESELPRKLLMGAAAILLLATAAGCGPNPKERADAEQQVVVADVERLLAIGTKDSVSQANAEMIQKIGPLKIEGDPALNALMNRVKATDRKVFGPSDAELYVERVETTWLPLIEAIPTAPPPSVPAVWEAVSKIEEVTQGLAEGEGFKADPAVAAARKKLRSALVARQVAAYPALRRGFTKATAALVWERNIEVSSRGPGDRQIIWTGGMFADNAAIAAAQSAVGQNLVKLRFTQSGYRWIPSAGAATYKLSPPPDAAVGIWTGGQFGPLD